MAGQRVKPPRWRHHKTQASFEDKAPTNGYGVRKELTSVLENEQTSANARVFAARTLAEMDGLIGKHQAAPSQLSTTPIASLSREQLTGELERLRTAIDLGLVR